MKEVGIIWGSRASSGSKRDRRFFCRFITSTLAALRQIESSLHYQKAEKTDSFATGSKGTKGKDKTCLVDKCGVIYVNKRQLKSQNLALRSLFRKMDLREKKRIVSKNKSCFNGLGTGHISSECKSNVTCKSCRGKHHSLLCHASGAPGGSGGSSGFKPADKDKKHKFRKEQTIVSRTESEETNDEPADEIVESLEVTSNNLGRSFDITSAES